MDYANLRSTFAPEHSLAAKPAYFDDNESAVLDASILESDAMQTSDHPSVRKTSLASPSSHSWGYVTAEPGQYAGDSAGFVHHGSPARQQPVQYRPQHLVGPGHSWVPDRAATRREPAGPVGFVHSPSPYNAHHVLSQRFEGVHGDMLHAIPEHPPRSIYTPLSEPSVMGAPAQTPKSPHNQSDWMAMAQQEAEREGERRPMARRTRGPSAPRTDVDWQRNNGVRKKNAKLDIPEDRTSDNIDQLLQEAEEARNDTLYKELRQQKRLLRNREAALASRQRKKKHTEGLEDREKEYMRQLPELKDQIAALQSELLQAQANCQMLCDHNGQLCRQVHTLEDDKSGMARRHEEEASALRRRLLLLEQHVDTNPAAPVMSAEPSSTGFNDFNADMKALSVGAHDWDHFTFVNQQPANDAADTMSLSFDPRPNPTSTNPPELQGKTPTNPAAASAQTGEYPAEDEQPVTSSLLFFLLLCGAFVASKPATSHATGLPQVPANVRAAAPAVLNSLLADIGGTPQPSGSQSSSFTTSTSAAPAPSRSGNRASHMQDRLTTPGRSQDADSAFSLTAAQYSSIAQDSQIPPHGQLSLSGSASRPRPTLAETIAGLHLPPAPSQHQPRGPRLSAADVYTRSVLSERIPTDVVRHFKEMVRGHDEAQAQRLGRLGQALEMAINGGAAHQVKREGPSPHFSLPQPDNLDMPFHAPFDLDEVDMGRSVDDFLDLERGDDLMMS